MVTTFARKRCVGSQRTISPAVREQVDRLLGESYAFIDSPLLRRGNIELQWGDAQPEPLMPAIGWYHPTTDDADSGKIVAHPKTLTPAEERVMFHRFNFAKMRLVCLQRQAVGSGLTRASAEWIIEWHRRFRHYHDFLVRTNLLLVLAMAKRMRLDDADFAEVVSEGNMALLRAIDKFDVDRGFKFSTYACRAIIKALYRTSKLQKRRRARFPMEFDPDMEQNDWIDKKRDVVEEDSIDDLRQVVDRNLAGLNEVEQLVIRNRFNWEDRLPQALTLHEVGMIIGASNERARQIQNKALGKIRQLMKKGVRRDVKTSAVTEEFTRRPGPWKTGGPDVR